MTKDVIIPIIVAIISSGTLSTIITMIYTQVEKRKAKATAETIGIRVLLENEINNLGREYMRQGFIYGDDKERLERMWRVYHCDLGGNGFLDAVMSEVKKLEVKWR